MAREYTLVINNPKGLKAEIREHMKKKTHNEITPEAKYTVAEASQISGITEGAIRNAMSAGRLQSIKEGDRRLIPASALDAYVANAKEKAPDHLVAALTKRIEENAKRPDKHIDFAVGLLNLIYSNQIQFGHAGPSIEFLKRHPELKPSMEPLIHAAIQDLSDYAMRIAGKPAEEKQVFDRMIEKSCSAVRLIVVAAIEKKVKLIEQAMEHCEKVFAEAAKK